MTSSVEQAHRRLEHLYEISKLFAGFEDVEQTLDPTLGIVAQVLPLHSAILIETFAGRSRMFVWPSEGQTVEDLHAVKEHVGTAYTYLVGAGSIESLNLSEQPGMSPLPRQTQTVENPANKFIVIPLVVAHRPPFGALQLEGAAPLDKTDLMFINAVANQLAIAIDRDRARQLDITRREQAEEGRTQYEVLANENARLYEQAQRAVRGREQILAIVSHDLRNPLGTILMTTGLLAKRSVSEERRRGLPQAVGRIQRSAERMLRLIEDLLDFASIEAGGLAVRRKPHDPGSMLQETVASFEGAAHEHGLRVTATVALDLPKVFCDRDRILQVLSNLVGNATKVTPAGGHITLTVEAREPDLLLFAVADDGPGISEEDLKHLFERYWRSDDVEYKGTGLGLAIARGIIVAHGGVMWVESELGHGATFRFTVPAADETSLFTVPRPDETSPFRVPAT